MTLSHLFNTIAVMILRLPTEYLHQRSIDRLGYFYHMSIPAVKPIIAYAWKTNGNHIQAMSSCTNKFTTNIPHTFTRILDPLDQVLSLLIYLFWCAGELPLQSLDHFLIWHHLDKRHITMNANLLRVSLLCTKRGLEHPRLTVWTIAFCYHFPSCQ